MMSLAFSKMDCLKNESFQSINLKKKIQIPATWITGP